MNYKNILIKILKLISLIIVVILTIFIINQYKSYKLEYGKKSNEIRKSANIPTIKSLMYSKNVNNDLLGNQWTNIRKEPSKGEVIHIWKIAIPKDDNKTLFRERDAFRKMNKNGIIYQLNINSVVENGNILKQNGILFEVQGSYENRKEISGVKLKTLMKKWKILELN